MTQHTPFLKQIAQIYAENYSNLLVDCCFVFPNKRSATFFRHYLRQVLRGAFIEPQLLTISDFIASFSTQIEADRYEQLAILYNEYNKLSDDISNFDQFVFWGDMLLNDFDDVDRYLIDHDAIFINLKRIKEINSDYLTPEQKEIIRHFWGEDNPVSHINDFWSHVPHHAIADEQNPHHRFLKLWEVLSPLYKAFRNSLLKRGLASQGMFYRQAVEALSEADAASLSYKRFIFVGFNALSTAELKIFQALRNLQVADFYWDYNSPALTDNDNRAAMFLRKYVSEFPSLHPLPEEPIKSLPKIDIIGVASNIGQVKCAGKQLQRWIDENHISNPSNAINTAIVLPDEQLFMPMINSVPQAITTLNATMGFPMRLSPATTLIREIVTLQLNLRPITDEDQPSFFINDVRTLLNNPLVRAINEDQASSALVTLNARRIFRVPASFFDGYDDLKPIFTPVPESTNTDIVFSYIHSLIEYLICKTPEKGEEIRLKLLKAYDKAASRLQRACNDHYIVMRNATVFHLIDRVVATDTVPFEGKPLQGLQVMGMLETRTLDFDNLIVMSLNERIFPRRLLKPSFIPENLRRGYGMATIDLQESIFSYYFYRLLSRASRVTLLYDGRSVGSNSSDMSRYLAQLLYLYNDSSVTHTMRIYSMQSFNRPLLVVDKTPRIVERLNRFLNPESKCYLSASAINQYITCPLSFYLKYVEDYRLEDHYMDFMDSGTYGSIVHEVLQGFYLHLRGNKPEVTVTADTLLHYADKDHVIISRLCTESINKYFNHLGDHCHTPLNGEALVMHKVIHQTVNSILRVEAQSAPFNFIDAEKVGTGFYPINDKVKVNMKYIIDRIDRRDSTLQFIDYKTGNDKLAASSLESCFDPLQPKRPKAIMQLLLYCHLYAFFTGDERTIKPVIFKIRDILSKKKIEDLIIEKNVVEDYHTYNDEFKSMLQNTLSDIFDVDKPFVPVPDDDHCNYCSFKQICGFA